MAGHENCFALSDHEIDDRIRSLVLKQRLKKDAEKAKSQISQKELECSLLSKGKNEYDRERDRKAREKKKESIDEKKFLKELLRDLDEPDVRFSPKKSDYNPPTRGRIRPKRDNDHAQRLKSSTMSSSSPSLYFSTDFLNESALDGFLPFDQSKIRASTMSALRIQSRLRQEEREKLLLAAEIDTEVWALKERLMACIDEANVFSHSLSSEAGSVSYRLNCRDGRDIPTELAVSRFDQLTVIATTGDGLTSSIPNSAMTAAMSVTRTISAENFLVEHDRLYEEVRKRRTLMASRRATEERLSEKIAMKSKGLKDEIGGLATSQSVASRIMTAGSSLHRTTSRPASTVGTAVFEREKAAVHLREIARNIDERTDELELQMEQIRSRGWNLPV